MALSLTATFNIAGNATQVLQAMKSKTVELKTSFVSASDAMKQAFQNTAREAKTTSDKIKKESTSETQAIKKEADKIKEAKKKAFSNTAEEAKKASQKVKRTFSQEAEEAKKDSSKIKEAFKSAFSSIEKASSNTFKKLKENFKKSKPTPASAGGGKGKGGLLGSIGGAMAFGGSAAIGAAAAVGLTTGISDAVSKYQEFDDAILQVKAISKATEEEYGKMRQQAKDLGRTTRYTATEVAEAQKYQAMAGWKTNQILSATPAIMNLATASGEQLATVSDIVTDSMTAFHWEAKDATKFTDILAATATSANTNVGMMGESFKYVAPSAANLGESIQETATFLGVLANSGMKASQAGTSLNMIFSSLLTPSDNASMLLEKMNVKLQDAKGNFLGLDNVLKQIKTSMDKAGLGSYERGAVLSTIFGERGGRAANILMSTSDKDVNSLRSKIYNSSGETKKMANTMDSGMGGSLERLKSSFNGLLIEVMEKVAPVLIKTFDGLGKALDNASKYAPLITALFQYWKSYALAIINIVKTDGKDIIEVLQKVWQVLSSPTAIKIYIASFKAIGEVGKFVLRVTVSTINLVFKVIKHIATVIGTVIAGVIQSTVGVWQILKTVATTVFDLIRGRGISVKQTLLSLLNGVKNLFHGFMRMSGVGVVFDYLMSKSETFRSIITTLWNYVKAFVSWAGSAIDGVLKKVGLAKAEASDINIKAAEKTGIPAVVPRDMSKSVQNYHHRNVVNNFNFASGDPALIKKAIKDTMYKEELKKS